MARIRSVHPGLFTDEAFVGLSCDAQIFLIGIYTECDDQGIFEWKPVQLRMRLRPAKDGPVEPLLDELESADTIRRFSIGGRTYGAVRNFRKYQRPKSPNAIHPLTPEIRNYVCLTDVISEMNTDERRTIPEKAEIPPQMEEGGDKMEDEGGKRTPIAPKGADVDYPAVVEIWNELAAETKIPSVQNLTDTRKTKIRHRLSDLGGMEGFHALCGKIRGSPFLLGDNAQRFTATFDWVLNPANLTKIMEGNYDAKLSKANGHGPSKAERATARSRAELAEAIRIAEAQEAGQRAGSGGQGSELLS